jgi:hypothetical protein
MSGWYSSAGIGFFCVKHVLVYLRGLGPFLANVAAA